MNLIKIGKKIIIITLKEKMVADFEKIKKN
jgi:hypothetical protein